MTKKLTGKGPAAYIGVEATTPPNMVAIPQDPIADNYNNFNIGAIWLNNAKQFQDPPVAPSGNDIWMLVRKYQRVATWTRIGGVTSTLTGDVGGPIESDDNANINVLGGTGITTSGDMATHTITWDVSEDVPLIWRTDSGDAVPSGNSISIVGGSGIDTQGVGDQVTVNIDGDVATLYTADAGSAAPSSNNLNVFGATYISTSGAGDTLTVSETDDVAAQFTGNIGVAVPVANNLNVVGGTNIQTIGAGDTLTIDSTFVGVNTGFMVDLSADIPNILGNNVFYPNPPYPRGQYTIPFDRVIFDIEGNYSIPSESFVAPATGFYAFWACGTVYNVSIPAMNNLLVRFIKREAGSGFVGIWGNVRINAGYCADSNLRVGFSIRASLPMEINDKLYVSLGIDGGSRTAGVYSGGTSPASTWFCGYRIN